MLGNVVVRVLEWHWRWPVQSQLLHCRVQPRASCSYTKPLSPSNIIWYKRKLGSKQALWKTGPVPHAPAASAHAWLVAKESEIGTAVWAQLLGENITTYAWQNRTMKPQFYGLKITFRGRPWAVPVLAFSPRFPDRDERRPPSAGTGRCQALPAAVLGASASSAQTHTHRISRTDQKTCENRILKWFQHPQWKHDVHLIRCYTKAEVGTRQSRAIGRLAKFIH